MASKSKCNLLLLSAVVLASISAATAASEYGYSECFLGIGFPSNDPLPSCRDYVAQQICGVFTPGSPFLATGQPYLASKMQCCQELASVPQQCRCEALRYLKGLPPSRPDAILELPGCPREVQGQFVTLLVAPGQCNLVTLEGAPYCPAVDKPLMRAAAAQRRIDYYDYGD